MLRKCNVKRQLDFSRRLLDNESDIESRRGELEKMPPGIGITLIEYGKDSMKSVITNCGGKNMILQNLMQDGGNNGKGRPTSTEFIKKIIDLNMLHPPLFLHIVCNLPLLSHPLPKLMLGGTRYLLLMPIK